MTDKHKRNEQTAEDWQINVERRLTRVEVEIIGVGGLVVLHLFGADALFAHALVVLGI